MHPRLGKAVTENQLGGTMRTGMVDFSGGLLQGLRVKGLVISWGFGRPQYICTLRDGGGEI